MHPNVSEQVRTGPNRSQTIQKLRKEAETALGKNFDLRAFHDEILGYGPVPMEVLGGIVRRWISRHKQAGDLP